LLLKSSFEEHFFHNLSSSDSFLTVDLVAVVRAADGAVSPGSPGQTQMTRSEGREKK